MRTRLHGSVLRRFFLRKDDTERSQPPISRAAAAERNILCVHQQRGSFFGFGKFPLPFPKFFQFFLFCLIFPNCDRFLLRVLSFSHVPSGRREPVRACVCVCVGVGRSPEKIGACWKSAISSESRCSSGQDGIKGCLLRNQADGNQRSGPIPDRRFQLQIESHHQDHKVPLHR